MGHSFKMLGGVCLAALVATPALAQNAAKPAAPAETVVLEEIVVTARLRAETLQSVPLAISALTEKEIERAGVTDMSSLSAVSSGLQLDSTGSKSTVTPVIRGLSQVSRIDDENNVPLFIDGVYVSGREGIDGSLIDVERIEVVKGPQSALYGRNSYAGSINYITRKPTDEVVGSASLTVGDDDRFTSKASISGPLVAEKLFARLAAAYDQWDGSYATDDLKIGGYQSRFVSGGLRLVLDSGFEANATVYYANDDVGPSPQILLAGNCQVSRGKALSWCGAYPSFGSDPDMSGYDSRADGLHRQSLRSSLTLTQDFEGMRLSSITGYNRLIAQSWVDWDRQYHGLPYGYTLNGQTGTVNLTSILTGASPDNYDASQEFRLESNDDGPLEWIVGASYYGFLSKLKGPYATDTTPVPAGAKLTSAGAIAFAAGLRPLAGGPLDEDLFTALFSRSRKRTTTYAEFGAIQYTFADALTARAELRHTSERKELEQFLPVAPKSRETFTYWTPRLTLDYQVDGDVLLYASAARGAKAGGFNSAAPTATELAFGPEFNWTYEAGIKSDFLNKRLRLNAALFDVEMKNIQITAASVTAPATFVTQNAGTGRSRGFEIDLTAKPVDGLTLQAGYSLADAKFKTAKDGSLRSYPSYVTNYDVSGNPLPRQAKHLINAMAQYETALTEEVDGYIRGDVRYESKKYGFTAPDLGYVKGRTVVNAKIGLVKGTLDTSLWVRNLFNDKTPLLAGSSLTMNDAARLPYALLPDLRTIGVTANYKF